MYIVQYPIVAFIEALFSLDCSFWCLIFYAVYLYSNLAEVRLAMMIKVVVALKKLEEYKT